MFIYTCDWNMCFTISEINYHNNKDCNKKYLGNPKANRY